MIIKNSLRPTTIRTNAPFRGPTSMNKYSNFILESVHDIKLLASTMDRNEYIVDHKGHSDFIKDNLAAYVSGTAPVTSSMATAGILHSPQDPLIDNVDLMSMDWVTYGGSTRTESPDGIILDSTALSDPSGIATQKLVEEGDIIYIRLGVRLLSGTANAFAIGSHDINQGEGDMKKYKIPQNGSIIYVDKRLYCKHREPISINIDVHNVPSQLVPAKVEIVDVQFKYMLENNMSLKPIDTALKTRTRDLEERIKNIINTI